MSTHINNNYIKSYLGNSSYIYDIKKDEIDTPPIIHREESASQTKNYRNKKYDDIDLNTFFSKSKKKEDKIISNNQNNKNNNNYRYIGENGGIKINEYNNSNKIKTIQEEEYNDSDLDNINYETKSENLKNIIISSEIKDIKEKKRGDIKKNNNINEFEINEQEQEEENEENEEEENENNEIYTDSEKENDLVNLNKELINKISILKKEVEISKNEMRKKDKKLLKYLNQFDKIASENANNRAEIENLEEELMNRKTEMDKKTKKINELMNKNIDLEQEMNQLKIYYRKKESNKAKYNYNNTENDYNDINNDNYYESEDNEIENNNNIYQNEETSEDEEQYDELNIDELHSIRNSLIKKRNDITFLYNKLPIKLVSKEHIRQKIEYENQLTKINNHLMKIRLQLKNYNE